MQANKIPKNTPNFNIICDSGYLRSINFIPSTKQQITQAEEPQIWR